MSEKENTQELPTEYLGKTSGLWCKDCGVFHDFAPKGCRVQIAVWTKNGYKYQ